MNKTLCVVAGCALTLAGPALAQTLQGTLQPPAIDRWMYPFGGSPGAEASAATFRTPPDATFNGQPAFDDRDAELLVVFNTTSVVPAGLGRFRYLPSSVTFTATTSNQPRFEYDATFDSVRTCYLPTDPQFLADSDTGKPVELFAVGFRNGLNVLTFQENTQFAFASPVLEGVRNAFPALPLPDGRTPPPTDISNQVRDRFEATPLAIGIATEIVGSPGAALPNPGELVPQNTRLTFTIDLSNPATRAYVQRGLEVGRLAFIVSSLHLADGGPGGGSGNPAYPAFYTKENIISTVLPVAPTLSLSLSLNDILDYNNDGDFPTPLDVEDLILALAGSPCATCGSTDINGDGDFPTPLDLEYFICLTAGGSPTVCGQ